MNNIKKDVELIKKIIPELEVSETFTAMNHVIYRLKNNAPDTAIGSGGMDIFIEIKDDEVYHFDENIMYQNADIFLEEMSKTTKKIINGEVIS